MASAGMALDRQPAPRNGGGVPDWLKQIFVAAVIFGGGWLLATSKADAVQENRITTVEKNVDSKASKESMDAMDKRLEKMDQKLDRLLERRK